MKRKHTYLTITKAVALSLLFIFSNGCSKNDDSAPSVPEPDGESLRDIISVVASLPEIEVFSAALANDPSLTEVIGNTKSQTVFAPSDRAWTNLFERLEAFGGLQDFDTENEKRLLSEILRYHVVTAAQKESEALTDGAILKTALSDTLKVAVSEAIYLVDESNELGKLTDLDILASNGILHIVDKVLIPERVAEALFPQETLASLIETSEELSGFNDALVKAGLRDRFNTEGPYTVFAPSNRAIEQLFETLGEGYEDFDDFDNFLEVQLLEKLLLYHVVGTEYSLNNIPNGDLPTLLEGNALATARVDGKTVIVDASDTNANFVAVDRKAANGSLHIVDKILIPQELVDLVRNPSDTNRGTIGELMTKKPEFSLLQKALELTGLENLLRQDGTYTLFAPENNVLTALFPFLGEAISNLEDIDTESEIALLRKILMYHILPQSLPAAEFSTTAHATLSEADSLQLLGKPNGYVVIDATGL